MIGLKSADYWNSRKYLYLFVGPAIISLVLIVILPTIFLWYVSFTSYDLGMGWEKRTFVGLQNFYFLISGQDREFWPSVIVSLEYMVISTVIEFILGFAIAILFNRKMIGKRLWMSCLLVPLTVTPAVVALMWKLMYNTEYGVINYILGFLGISVNWLSSSMALISVIIVDIWQWTPFVALILYAGLQALPQEPYEASMVDGASSLQVFRYITLPMMRPMITIAILLRSIDALKVFDTVYGLTQGGPGNATELLSLHIYRLGFQHTGWIGRSSAAAIVLLLFTTVLSTYLLRALRRDYKAGEGI
ncbi:MAG TPA: sugar ABC transporter permease [Firmicutes bacterium]|nr:sugar ABC transporter permease [Bacillota bacterium]